MVDFASKNNFKITPYSLTDYSHIVDEAYDAISNEMQFPIIGGINEEVCLTKHDVLDSLRTGTDLDLSSFIPQKQLHPKIFPNGTLNSKVRLRLMDISDDFLKFLNISWAKPIDVILTGSLANFNWSRYSDFDLHILMDFKDIDERRDFVKEYVDAKKNLWNDEHENLKIYGFPVELYVQDVHDEFEAKGVYSLYKNIWYKKPSKKSMSLDKSDFPEIKRQSIKFMKQIDKLESLLDVEKDTVKIEKIGNAAKALLNKLKGIRKDSLKHNGEMSSGNIIYKVLRRCDYLEKLFNIKALTYDKIKTIN